MINYNDIYRTPGNIYDVELCKKVHHFRTNYVNVYISRIHPSGPIFKGAYIQGCSYLGC